MSRDVFEDVIDPAAALATLRALVNDEEIFVAAGLVHLGCGHLRPTNRRVTVGDTYPCVLCGDQTIVRLELIEPTVFPHSDALRDLPVIAA